MIAMVLIHTLITTVALLAWTSVAVTISAEDTLVDKSKIASNNRNLRKLHIEQYTGKVEAAIAGGEVAAEGEFPFFVTSSRRSGVCGGVLIHEDIVLSAGHCLDAFREGLIVGCIDTDDRNSGIFRDVSLQNMYTHPNYIFDKDDKDGSPLFQLDWDFMIIKLENPITTIEPAAINTDMSNPAVKQNVTVSNKRHASARASCQILKQPSPVANFP